MEGSLYKELSDKHDSYCGHVTDDERYDEEEQWIEECRECFVNTELAVNDYLISRNHGDNRKDSITKDDQGTTHIVNDSDFQAILHNSDCGSPKKNCDNLIGSDKPKENKVDRVFGLKLRKEFLPTFSGDIREYGVFKSDFKHLVDNRCSERDSMALLRISLKGSPSALIRGITHDYNAAWEYLDSVYGDPRYVADAITQDLATFPCLEDGEDTHFCDLVHLVRRSYNTLNELGRASDMDNNHVLTLIEQKMCTNDRRNWSRELVKERKPATFKCLLEWISTEMVARMRSSAPLRNAVQSNNSVSYVTDCVLELGSCNNNRDTDTLPDKCWLCHTSDHWTDQCDKMKAMNPEERLKTVQDNHACYSCLKRAGRRHTSDNCYRRRRCTMMNCGEQCKLYHHTLLHGATKAIPNGNVRVAPVISNATLLPAVSIQTFGSHGHQRISNALVDSGAQISLIRNDLAHELDLEGRDTVVK